MAALWKLVYGIWQDIHAQCASIYHRAFPALHLDTGSHGEALAARVLKRNGLAIIERNHRNAGGEIDFVAIDRRQRTLVFVEVKAKRGPAGADSAGARIDAEKRRRITSAALAYLRRNRLGECRVRFDVITIHRLDGPGPPEIIHERNAFEASYTEVCSHPNLRSRRWN